MDVRADLFVNLPKFLEEINGQLGAIQLQVSPQSSHLSGCHPAAQSGQQNTISRSSWCIFISI